MCFDSACRSSSSSSSSSSDTPAKANFVLEGDARALSVVKLSLVKDGDSIRLIATNLNTGRNNVILDITGEGKLLRHRGIGSDYGLRRNDAGQILMLNS
jgi:hypothetical protein